MRPINRRLRDACRRWPKRTLTARLQRRPEGVDGAVAPQPLRYVEKGNAVPIPDETPGTGAAVAKTPVAAPVLRDVCHGPGRVDESDIADCELYVPVVLDD